MFLGVDGNVIGAIIGVGGAVGISVASGAWRLARSMGSIEQLVRDMNKSQQQIDQSHVTYSASAAKIFINEMI